MEEFLKIGLITKPQGITGELKINPLTDDINRFKNLKEVFIDGVSYKVLKTKIGGENVFMYLLGVADRNASELLRGKFISVKRQDAVPLGENSFFITDLMNAKLYDEQKYIGVIVDILSAKTDVFTVKEENGKIFRFPFLKDLLIKVDIENKTVTVKAKRLAEISVYED